jgi:hypothetical protein
MDLTAQVDGYCERLDPSFWAEPVNAITNLAFLIAAAVMWPRVRGMMSGQVLAGVLAVIGIGSGLFHTFAQVWAGIADVLPILAFILIYIAVANRDFWGMRPIWAYIGALMFLPFAAATVPLFQLVPGLGGSAGYAPVPLLILLYAVGLRRRLPTTARNLAIGAGILILSILFRSLDMPICAAIPLGTHFLWHILNAIMLAWMIETWRRFRLGGR